MSKTCLSPGDELKPEIDIVHLCVYFADEFILINLANAKKELRVYFAQQMSFCLLFYPHVSKHCQKRHYLKKKNYAFGNAHKFCPFSCIEKFY